MKKMPNPVDRYVGSRLRKRRIDIGLSQGRLGDSLDVTFQQIQKYEKGSNRMGASRLQQAAKVLGVPVAYFFEGAPVDGVRPEGFAEGSTAYTAEPRRDAQEVALLAAFSRVRDVKLRRRIVDLVEAMAPRETS